MNEEDEQDMFRFMVTGYVSNKFSLIQSRRRRRSGN
jgi:hypothetical protein